MEHKRPNSAATGKFPERRDREEVKWKCGK
jgi:hypothetical protein